VDSVSALMIYIFSAMATGGAVVAGQDPGRRERAGAVRCGVSPPPAAMARTGRFFVCSLTPVIYACRQAAFPLRTT